MRLPSNGDGIRIQSPGCWIQRQIIGLKIQPVEGKSCRLHGDEKSGDRGTFVEFLSAARQCKGTGDILHLFATPISLTQSEYYYFYFTNGGTGSEW